MSYKNKTYVIFDGDTDMWAYAYMKGWKQNERVDFDFYDAHDIRPLTDRASEETVKSRLRERMSNAKQVIVLVGEHTKNLFKFVRWEMDLAIGNDLPIVVVNLNNKRDYDADRCPPILRDVYAVHVAFKMKIIKYALDNFPDQYERRPPSAAGQLQYNSSVYEKLQL
jgi:hypothetical protein